MEEIDEARFPPNKNSASLIGAMTVIMMAIRAALPLIIY
jgi:hypothetical protein